MCCLNIIFFFSFLFIFNVKIVLNLWLKLVFLSSYSNMCGSIFRGWISLKASLVLKNQLIILNYKKTTF